MQTIIFDGRAAAASRAAAVKEQVAKMPGKITLVSVFFEEDAGSVLYTRLKEKAALEAGLGFQKYAFRMFETEAAKEKVRELVRDPAVKGIIIQKPMNVSQSWWRSLTALLSREKDVDGLTDNTLFLPATVKAVMIILEEAINLNSKPNISVIGCSDIIGRPLADVLERKGLEIIRHCKRIDEEALAESDVVVSATGRPNSITGAMIKEGVVVVDVGAPKGDVDAKSVIGKARFLTPVPGGVGPLTVTCLLENTVGAARVYAWQKASIQSS